jgi:hypothetical protein
VAIWLRRLLGRLARVICGPPPSVSFVKLPAALRKKFQSRCSGGMRRRVVLDDQVFDEIFDRDALGRTVQLVERLIFGLIESVVSLGNPIEVDVRDRVFVLGILGWFVGYVVVAQEPIAVVIGSQSVRVGVL